MGLTEQTVKNQQGGVFNVKKRKTHKPEKAFLQPPLLHTSAAQPRLPPLWHGAKPGTRLVLLLQDGVLVFG